MSIYTYTVLYPFFLGNFLKNYGIDGWNDWEDFLCTLQLLYRERLIARTSSTSETQLWIQIAQLKCCVWPEAILCLSVPLYLEYSPIPSQMNIICYQARKLDKNPSSGPCFTATGVSLSSMVCTHIAVHRIQKGPFPMTCGSLKFASPSLSSLSIVISFKALSYDAD